jgi:CMP-N,N'-diacetyllegionaminic acid synthase
VLLALIPARGGSKGISRKNARPFRGKPLVVWAVEAALASGVCDRIVVSTDDDEIEALARAAGADVVRRPPEVAADEVSTAEVARHALDTLGERPDLVLVLEPTSPARSPEHVREAAALLTRGHAESIASVSEVPHHYVPSKALQLGEDGAIAGVDGTSVARMTHRRQDLETVYAFNGIIFGCRGELLRRDPPTLWGDRVVAQVLDSRFAIDLDRPEDWAPAEARVEELARA